MNPTVAPMNPIQPPMNPTVAPMNPIQPPMNPTVAPMNPIQPPMNPTVAPMNPIQPLLNPTVDPLNPIQRPLNPTVAPIQFVYAQERAGRDRLGTYPPPLEQYGDIPPPIPEGMMQCPKENCRKLISKKSFVCPECRVYLPCNETVESETSTLIPIEKWSCTSCTFTNTTAKGRSRVCDICQATNPIEMSPTTFVERSTHKYSEPEDTKVPTAYTHVQQKQKNSSINPQNNLSMNSQIFLSMNPQDLPADYRSINPNYPPGDYPQYRQGNQAPKGDWNPQYPQRDPPRNPQEEYPQMYGQLGTSIFGTNYPRMEEPFKQRDDSRNMPGVLPAQPAKDPKEHFPLLRMPVTYGKFHNPAPTAPYKYIKHIIGQNYGFKDEALQLAINKFGV